MPRKAATALAALLVFGSASTVLANASETDDHGSLAQRPKSMTANGRTGADNGAAKPFTRRSFRSRIAACPGTESGSKHDRRILRPESGTIQSIHILCVGTAGALDLETGVAGGVQIPRFQRDTKRIGPNYFIDWRCADAGPRSQNSGNSWALGSRRNADRR
jgi:hypothetical protein